MEQPLISIIIPTYNRAHLIGETLNSVLAQTYPNWECIVVDDGSTDNTEEVVEAYVKRDTRFQYHHRPKDRPKGTNACRNYGFEMSRGDYVNWFDDDDVMLNTKIETQLNVLLDDPKLDFCIAKFSNFNFNRIFKEEISYRRNNDKLPNYKDYLRHKLFWGTIDFIGKRNIFKNVKFNEFLKSGQEYHFFVLVLLNKRKGIFVDDILAERRIHEESIQQKNCINFEQKNFNKVEMYWFLYRDGKNKFDNKDKMFLMKECYLFIQKLMKIKIIHPKQREIHVETKELLGFFKVFKLKCLLWLTFFTGKGDVRVRRSIKNCF